MELANKLANNIPQKEVSLGVGNFAFENTDMLSPLSSMLRDELEADLAATGRCKVVTRDRLADLQTEGKFQGKAILEPGTGVQKVSVEGIKGIVRGRFYAGPEAVTVFAELVWLEGGEVKKSKVEVPLRKIGAKIWPNQNLEPIKMGNVVKPQNPEASAANIQEIASGRLAKIPQDFRVEVFTTDGKRAYAEGETVSFRVRSTEECHIAVLCHQSDGTTVVLFPNSYSSNTLIPADKAIDIPGTHKSGFEIQIGAPFGSDVVEVIACSKASELHKAFSQFATQSKEQPFQVLTRGMAVKGISAAVASKPEEAAPLRWGQDSIVVSTFPKP